VPVLIQTAFKVLVQEEDHLPAILFAISWNEHEVLDSCMLCFKKMQQHCRKNC
jgi:hypothetical protein